MVLSRNKIKKYVILGGLIAGTVLLSACAKKETSPMQASEQVSSINEESEEAKENQKETDISEPLTLHTWGDTLTYTEPQFGVWNFKTGNGTMLEGLEEYSISEDEWLVVYTPENYGEITFNNGPGMTKNLDIYGKLTVINYAYKAENDIEITVKGITVDDEILNIRILFGPQVFSFENWIEELVDTETEPKLLVYNDVTEEKTILNNGDTYQLKEGDITALYYNLSDLVDNNDDLPLLYPSEFEKNEYVKSCEEPEYCYQIFELVEGDTINFEYTFSDVKALGHVKLEDLELKITFTR